MLYYLKNGNRCFRYHELFLNGLLSVLYGALGHNNKEFEEYVRSFEKWCFTHHQNEYKAFELGKMTIKPENRDKMTFFAIFEENKSKKQKINK